MVIAAEDVARVREATDIVALIGERTSLKKQGRRWVGLCPFHAENTPSFSVNAEEGLYYCFGCQASGDAIGFLRDVEHMDFVEAVEALAARAGLAITHVDGGPADRGQRQGGRAQIAEAMTAAVAWYHERLLHGADAAPARAYLRSRSIDGDTVRRFHLGWAPGDWDALARAIKAPREVMSRAGLTFVNKAGRLQDAFRARVLFPIFDPSGQPVAFGGRILPGAQGAGASGDGPKYKNSTETPIYSKRRVLYGLNWAKASAARNDEIIVCEGYTDAIAFYQVGLDRAVATCGTTLTDDHVRLLARYARRLVLAYDADPAGQRAVEQYYAWERAYALEIRVAAFPPGSDPAEVAASQPEALEASVAGAKPLLEFRVSRLLERAEAARELTSTEGRVRTAQAALALVAEHPNELVRDQYLMEVADRCRIDPLRLRAELVAIGRAGARARRQRAGAVGGEAPPAGAGRTGSGPPPPSITQSAGAGGGGGEPRVQAGGASGRFDLSRGPAGLYGRHLAGGEAGGPVAGSGLEIEALRLAVQRPQDVADHLEEILFAVPLHRRAFQALATSPSLAHAIEAADEQAADLLRRLAVDAAEAPPDAREITCRLVAACAGRALNRLEGEARRDSHRFVELAPLTAWLRQSIDRLADPSGTDGASETADRLLAWLVQEGEEGA